MILGDSEIEKLADEQRIPAQSRKFINPASLNVRIGTTFLVPRRRLFGGITLGGEVKYRRVLLRNFDIRS